MEPKKILIIGSSEGKTALMHQMMKEKFGDDVILVTYDEAKEQGLMPDDFSNTTRMKIKSLPIFEPLYIHGHVKTGRENRRDRRKNERKLKSK
jgi:GTPase SAR1 family protein